MKDPHKGHKNGCGTKGLKWLSPDFVFTESCNIHDEDYHHHYVSKEEADHKFRQHMFNEAEKVENITLKESLKTVANVYYYAVKYGGHIPYYVFYWFRVFKEWCKEKVFNIKEN